MLDHMDAAARRQCLFAIGHNLVPILEPFAHLHVTIEVGSAELDRGEMQITIHDLPDTNFIAFTLDGSVGDQWSGRERRQVNRDFGQFTHWWQIVDGDLHFSPVKLGTSDLNGYVQVREGLKNGDQVVTYSEKALTARSRIHVVEHIPGVSR